MPPPGHTPRDLPIFFFLGGLFPTPELLIDLIYVRVIGSRMRIFWVHLFEINIDFRTIAKRDIFTTFIKVFWSLFREG